MSPLLLQLHIPLYVIVVLSVGILIQRWRKEEREKKSIAEERAAKDFKAKLDLAKTMVLAADKVKMPYNYADVVAEALDNADEYRGRRTEIQHRALYGQAFGESTGIFTAHERMAVFAKRHLADMPEVRRYDVKTLMHQSRWASERERTILEIIDLIDNYPKSRFATEDGVKKSAEIAARMQDYRATASEIRKKLAQEKTAIMVDRGLSAEEKAQQCQDLETLADVEIRALRKEVGISQRPSEEAAFLTKLLNQVKMLNTKQEAKAILEQQKRDRPAMAGAIEELLYDIDSGDWEEWRA